MLACSYVAGVSDLAPELAAELALFKPMPSSLKPMDAAPTLRRVRAGAWPSPGPFRPVSAAASRFVTTDPSADARAYCRTPLKVRADYSADPGCGRQGKPYLWTTCEFRSFVPWRAARMS